MEKEGFKQEVSASLPLQVGKKAPMDFTLQLGQVTQTMEVTAAAPLVRSETSELGEVINRRSVQSLSLNGRYFAQLVFLVPGVTQGQSGENLSGTNTFNLRAGSNFNALGSQANANAWLVDGIMDNEYTFNTVMVQPSVESVQEFKVLTGTCSAEFDRGAGVVTTQRVPVAINSTEACSNSCATAIWIPAITSMRRPRSNLLTGEINLAPHWEARSSRTERSSLRITTVDANRRGKLISTRFPLPRTGLVISATTQ